MAFDVSALVDYVEENSIDLQLATVNSAKMMDLVEVVQGVKADHKLPLVSNSVFFQEADCSFDASGSTTFTQRTLSPGKIKINLEWCPKDLESKYFSVAMSNGSIKEEVEPSEVFGAIIADYLAKVSLEIDKAIWLGDATSGTGNNAYWDGFIQTISSGYIDANSTSIYDGSALSGSFTAANAQEMAFRLYTALAENGLTQHSDTVAFIGYDAYAALQASLVLGGATFGSLINNGGGNPDSNAMEGLVFPGTNIKYIPVDGLTGSNKAYAGRKSNFFVGVDATTDVDGFEVWYSKDDRKVKGAMEFKVATQVAYPGEIAAIVL